MEGADSYLERGIRGGSVFGERLKISMTKAGKTR